MKTAIKLPEWLGLRESAELDMSMEELTHHHVRYWESRCRLAAKDLERFSYFDTNCHGTSFLCTCVGHTARRTLKAIGPLPGKQP
jgi:hypothetical protein